MPIVSGVITSGPVGRVAAVVGGGVTSGMGRVLPGVYMVRRRAGVVLSGAGRAEGGINGGR